MLTDDYGNWLLKTGKVSLGDYMKLQNEAKRLQGELL